MDKNYLLVSLEDEKSKNVAEVLGNSTCKKILNYLAEREACESEIAKDLGIPVNTAEYNLKKLVGVGLVEKAEKHFWSVKGKKIPVYKLSNKYIVIAPKSKVLGKLKNFFLTGVIVGVLAILIYMYEKSRVVLSATKQAAETFSSGASLAAAPTVADGATNAVRSAGNFIPGVAIWFFVGAVIALIIMLLLNWKKL